MMKKIVVLFIFFVSQFSWALELSTTVFNVDSHEKFASRPFVNESDQTKLYQVKVYGIKKPGVDEERVPILNGEIMYSPLNVVLEGGGNDVFKMYYNGPSDDKERYYRVIISELPFGGVENTNLEEKKIRFIESSIALNTYIVVKPRQENLNFTFDESTGTFQNTGNTYIRLMLEGMCSNGLQEEKNNSKFVYDVLPGQSIQNKYLTQGFEKFIVHKLRYQRLGSDCK